MKKICLSRNEINAISVFTRQRQLPRGFVLGQAARLDLSEDAMAVIRAVLGLNPDPQAMTVAADFIRWADALVPAPGTGDG